jgi:hypothetical protein
MLWALLAILGIPLWLLAMAVGGLVYRNVRLRRRPGNLACRVRAGRRWVKGNGLWVHDVFSFGAAAIRGSRLDWVRQASLRPPLPEEAGKLRRLSDPVVAVFVLDDGSELLVAASGNLQARLTGPLPPSAVSD